MHLAVYYRLTDTQVSAIAKIRVYFGRSDVHYKYSFKSLDWRSGGLEVLSTRIDTFTKVSGPLFLPKYKNRQICAPSTTLSV
jgi:UDP-galactopyranose mutase